MAFAGNTLGERQEREMYRLYTEDVNRRGIRKVLNKYFDAYTEIPGIGHWQGKQEQSLVVELANVSKSKVLQAAAEIKKLNRQDAVLVQHIKNSAVLV